MSAEKMIGKHNKKETSSEKYSDRKDLEPDRKGLKPDRKDLRPDRKNLVPDRIRTRTASSDRKMNSARAEVTTQIYISKNPV